MMIINVFCNWKSAFEKTMALAVFAMQGSEEWKGVNYSEVENHKYASFIECRVQVQGNFSVNQLTMKQSINYDCWSMYRIKI